MITPLDIHNKVFGGSFFGGYSREEVDLFLDKLVEDYEKIFKENIELKDRISNLNEALQHYKAMEETLQNTLIVAQDTAEDIKKNAYGKSDTIIKEAEMRASKIIDEANEKAISARKEYDEMKKNYTLFKSKMEGLINSHTELLRTSFNEEFAEGHE